MIDYVITSLIFSFAVISAKIAFVGMLVWVLLQIVPEVLFEEH